METSLDSEASNTNITEYLFPRWLQNTVTHKIIEGRDCLICFCVLLVQNITSCIAIHAKLVKFT